MDVVYFVTAMLALAGCFVALSKSEGVYAVLSTIILWLSTMNFVDEYKVWECQKTLPRNESCELIAVPSSTLVENGK